MLVTKRNGTFIGVRGLLVTADSIAEAVVALIALAIKSSAVLAVHESAFDETHDCTRLATPTISPATAVRIAAIQRSTESSKSIRKP